jgi:transposase InsO family protein
VQQRWATDEEIKAYIDGKRSGADTTMLVPHISVAMGKVSNAANDKEAEITRCILLPIEAERYRLAAVRRLHQSVGHVGAHKIARQLPTTGWHVEGAAEVIARVVLECDVCGERKGHPTAATSWRPSASADARIRPAAFNDVVHVDFVGPFHNAGGVKEYTIEFTDEFTRWVEAKVVSAESAIEAARAFLGMWVARYGQPRRLTSDRGKAFVGEVLGNLCALLGVDRVVTTAYHPQSNGIEERAHKTLQDIMATTMAQRSLQPHRWAETLDVALQVLRATVNRSTGFTPARLVLGYEMTVGDAVLRAPATRPLVRDGVLRLDKATGMQRAADEVVSRQGDLLDVYAKCVYDRGAVGEWGRVAQVGRREAQARRFRRGNDA